MNVGNTEPVQRLTAVAQPRPGRISRSTSPSILPPVAYRTPSHRLVSTLQAPRPSASLGGPSAAASARVPFVDVNPASVVWLLDHENPLAADFFFKGVFENLKPSTRQPYPNAVAATGIFESDDRRYDVVAMLRLRMDGQHDLLSVRVRRQGTNETPILLEPEKGTSIPLDFSESGPVIDSALDAMDRGQLSDLIGQMPKFGENSFASTSSVRLKVEQDQLVSGGRQFGLGSIGLQGA